MHKKKVTLRVAEQIQPATARVAELADALDLGSSAERRAGSTPASRTHRPSKCPTGENHPVIIRERPRASSASAILPARIQATLSAV